MGITDCITQDSGIVDYLYGKLFDALEAITELADVPLLTKENTNNSKDYPNEYVYIDVLEDAIGKYALDPCSFEQGITVAVECLLPYNKDELSRQIVRTVQSIFYGSQHDNYSIFIKSVKMNTAKLPTGQRSAVVIDITTNLNRG